MKSKTANFILCFIFLPCTASTQWFSQNSGTNSILWSTFFANNDVGWIVYGDTVIKTTNRGTTWVPSTVGIATTLTGVYFIDADTGWAVGGNLAGGSAILKTTDGGLTWKDVSPDVGTFMTGVFFADDRHGWAFGQDGFPGNGRIVATTNGGTTWTDQPVGSISYLESGFFIDTLTGWAVGANVILKTTDGGTIWAEQDTEYTHGPLSVPLHSAFFVNSDMGWVVGGIAWVSVIAKTTDGGQTWTHQIFQPPTPELDVGRLNWVHFVDDTTGWIVGRVFPGIRELILKTTNGGTTWFRQDTGIGSQLFSVYFADEKHGWTVGEDGTILATTNGGTTFVRRDNNLPNDSRLLQNYPNPFNPTTTIEFLLPSTSKVRISVYDVTGRLVTILVDDVRTAGLHRVTFDAAGSASGVYYYDLQAERFSGRAVARLVDVRKMMVVK
ncbi:MAG: YCF48-related protein [Ignavibacteria bacterium]|nr:YCF48-related protein [Ignavibacteria bacterium]